MTVETQQDKELIRASYQKLLLSCKRSDTPERKAMIEKAFHFACEAHKGVRRKSGEPYIIHPIKVAEIAAKEIGLGTKSIVAALLHDVVEDTDCTIEDIAHHFGDKVASIVDGLTKISGACNQETSMQAENFRKMLLTLSDDIRVIILKIADRLHNMRTLSSMPLRKQMKIAGETLFLFAPLAHRLGLYKIKSELEDLSLMYEHPEDYKDIVEKIKEKEAEQIIVIDQIIKPIKKLLNDNNITCTIINRPRSIFSIWNKIEYKKIKLQDIYDVPAIRVIFKPQEEIPEKNQCWNIYSLITDIYKPKPERIRDWMTTPKANGYEALHMTAMGPQGKWIEIQICSNRMNEIAERGFIAHSRNSDVNESELDKWLKDVREILENPESDALAFLDEFRLNLFSQEIQVFTPKGLIKTLPKHSSALDFAYNIHTDIGNHCIGAKVNHRLVSLNYVLRSGDQVEILTSDKQKPKPEWLDYVVTARAKSKIKAEFKDDRKRLIYAGIKLLEEHLINIGLVLNSKATKKLMEHYQFTNKDELFLNFGSSKLKLEEVKEIVKKKSRNKFIKYWSLQLFGSDSKETSAVKAENKPEIDKRKPFLLEETMSEEKYKIANCCRPIPGDDVVGYVDLENNVTIHKRKCPNALKLMSSQGDKIIEANWTSHRLMSFLAIIELSGIDKIGIVNDITSIISKDHDVNMRSIHFESPDGVFEGLIHLYVHNTEDLNNLMKKLIKIKGLDNVRRIENIEEYS
ncbi:bifunctional (p)ppGpp synthetase/guanosine-3',5'-bis(diphosphate) 3'-pyrophosphohydrolase [Ancylomarina sp. 16SWW S1-10-2]|uniref:RelA/SpoT family protein n=1 Tax=Ancylomarina sp. 16SWW S1-10-2 TaxID=2499681 RepID=UPI0012AE685E|nr:RelA/SpoT family protein [Ancylomarina sp. 16SWW S1-10-2]MRT91813.1 bifunctional (p)ppGpp synthetase/guanosine-3',5'-bis(diphosphate) 3'-pyrophosphohydrolase [Ancylomarina sp. 16SWW S1-10-2]